MLSRFSAQLVTEIEVVRQGIREEVGCKDVPQANIVLINSPFDDSNGSSTFYNRMSILLACVPVMWHPVLCTLFPLPACQRSRQRRVWPSLARPLRVAAAGVGGCCSGSAGPTPSATAAAITTIRDSRVLIFLFFLRKVTFTNYFVRKSISHTQACNYCLIYLIWFVFLWCLEKNPMTAAINKMALAVGLNFSVIFC